MITYAVLSHGRPRMADYTNPSSSVTINAGDIIVDGATLRIAHNDIFPLKQGALAMEGGSYRVPKASNGLTIDGGSANVTTAIADGTDVYWDATNKIIATSSNSGANLKLGVTENASSDTDTTQLVLHKAN